MRTIAKLAGLVVLLNVVRYTVGGFLEGFTIMEPMHRPLPLFPEAFDQDFSSYVAGIRPFYFWSMVDALIVFPVVALANALLYPRFFREGACVSGREDAV